LNSLKDNEDRILVGLAMLRIRLLGAGHAQYFDQTLTGFPNQQPCLLLCYLLLNRDRPHHRDLLATTFWGDYPPNTSRKYLRNALWRLRQSLQSVGAPPDEYIMVGDESISFIKSSSYWLDVECFEATMAQHQDTSGQDLSDEQVVSLEAAVDLYVGDLLDGVYEDWCLYDRERLNLMLLNALGKLMIYHGLSESYENGLACGERILVCDNTREKVHRLMMWLHWLSGDRNAALAQYKRCAQILRESLSIAPMTETTRLYQQMAHDRFDPASWLVDREDPTPIRASSADVIQPLAEHVLRKVQRLQEMVDETSEELRRVEHLLSTALMKSKES
jgi:DNA-binding SARP family transcriptional activator